MVRRNTVTSLLLALMLALCASACVVGVYSSDSTCSGMRIKQSCARKMSGFARSCGSRLKSSAAECNLRGLVQFYFPAFNEVESSAQLNSISGKISVPFGSRIIVSSVGSPETDRGPPRS
jgi:hypothetical protein